MSVLRKDRRLIVEEETTLLPFLRERLAGVSRNEVKGMLSRGQVLVAGQRETAYDCLLTPGTVVEVLARAPMGLSLPILYDDGILLAVNKPAGLPAVSINGAGGRSALELLRSALRHRDGADTLYPLHRLDRDTSGVLVFSRRRSLRDRFQEDWSRWAEYRGYVALVRGTPPENAGVVRTYLRENRAHHMYSAQDGRLAITRYRVLQRGSQWSLLEVSLETGRKNQIRVHLKELGCPVVGDQKYGDGSGPLGRLGLHANRLILRHPETESRLEITAPVPESFLRAVRKGERGR